MGPSDISNSSASLTTQAFRQLRADIIAGSLAPGERLRIQNLVDRYGIGATAIREALSRLTSDGLVDLQEQRGFCVASVSRDELKDLMRTLCELECITIRHAIDRGGIEWESNVVSSYHRLSRTPLPTSPELYADWIAVHSAFHEAMLAGCESPTLLLLCRLLGEKVARYHNLLLRSTTVEERNALEEHKQLMDAVISRDVALAEELTTVHFQRFAELVLLAFDKAFPTLTPTSGGRSGGRRISA